MPSDIAGLTYLRTDPGNREAIVFGLDQLLSSPETKPGSEIPTGRETHPIRGKADKFMNRLKLLREDEQVQESDLIEVIFEAIRESGVSTLAKNQEQDMQCAAPSDLRRRSRAAKGSAAYSRRRCQTPPVRTFSAAANLFRRLTPGRRPHRSGVGEPPRGRGGSY
jgi:hypothetical protein